MKKKEIGEIMDETKVKKLERQLADARAEMHNNNKVEINRNLDAVGIDLSTTVEKKIPDSNDIPDVILMPKKKRRTENKW
tara:strand:+ start:613 stop:852 length:240 start_codon:yes stop_codon:yes gene_type:complete